MARPSEVEEKSRLMREAASRASMLSDRAEVASRELQSTIDHVAQLTARVADLQAHLDALRVQYQRSKEELSRAKAELYVLRLQDLASADVKAIEDAVVKKWAATKVENEFDRQSKGVLRQLQQTLEAVLAEVSEGMAPR